MSAISLYTPYWSTRGGGERYLLQLATTLKRSFGGEVSVLMRPSDPPLHDLGRYFNLDISALSATRVQTEHEITKVTKESDVFILLSNVKPIKTFARKNVLLLQIPFPRLSTSSLVSDLLSGQWRDALKSIRRRALFAFAQTQADLVLCNSQFTAHNLAKNWDIRSEILYPPVQNFRDEPIPRRKVILSVGRFFAGLYNEKRYDLLTSVFRQLQKSSLPDWEYHLVGSSSGSRQSHRLIEQLQMENKGLPVFFHVNESYDSLRTLYNEATIFWHAAGYGVDEELRPERVEHFGMTTVEAMSAGCIPVVVNKGGQREIVQHNVSGYLWDTREQLAQYTEAIASGRAPLDRIQQQAQMRSRQFSVLEFERRVQELFSPLLR
ncbi:MAG TPA: glycosyltransferase family 4 protein [Bacteroidota bacterium]|nr:glycosyltransferase family 4 protein [Bacteroidota bacterium]